MMKWKIEETTLKRFFFKEPKPIESGFYVVSKQVRVMYSVVNYFLDHLMI